MSCCETYHRHAEEAEMVFHFCSVLLSTDIEG